MAPRASAAGNRKEGYGSVIVLNTALAQSLRVLGFDKFGMCQRTFYAQHIKEPPLSPAIFDIGTITEPNLELLAQIRPSLILRSPGIGPDSRALKSIAPVIDIPYYIDNLDHFDSAFRMLLHVARIVNAEEEANIYLKNLELVFDKARNAVAEFQGRSLLGIDMAWGTTFAVWGRGSPFDGALKAIGLHNAIRHKATRSAWAYASFQELFAMEDVWCVHFGPLSSKILSSPVWSALPFVRNDRLISLPATYQHVAGLPTVEHIARSLGQALEIRS